MQITIPYKPREYQKKVHNSQARYRVVVFHRRAGKTACAINELIKWATQEVGVYWYIAPTYKLGKEAVWREPTMLFKFLPKELIAKKNEVELTVHLINGSIIGIKGADDPDSLRGANPLGVILDEYGDMKTDVWGAVIRPVLEANKGKAIFIGTPKGKNHFYTIFNQSGEDWESFYLPASEGVVYSPEDLAKLKREMTERDYLQEIECYWHEGSGTVFRRILDNATAKVQEPEYGHLYFVGVDLAKHQDWTVISVFDRVTNRQVYFDRFNQLDWVLQEARIEAVARRYNGARIYIDKTGVGDPIEESLARKGLAVEGVTYTNDVKRDLVEKLSILLEGDKIKILPEAQQLSELQSFTYELTPNRRIRYTAPDGEHDDCVNALALSVYKLDDQPVNVTATQYAYEADSY